MPRYVYSCDACKGEFEVSHGMFHEQRECVLCNRLGMIVKKPSFTIKKTQGSVENRPGKIVDEFIQDAKKELKQQRKELKSEQIG